MFLVYAVTIALFPSLTSTIIAAPYSNSSSYYMTGVSIGARMDPLRFHASQAAIPGCEWAHLFVPLGFVLFNLGDMTGRGLPCLLRSPTAILVIVVCRIAFAPLFMLCHTAQGGALQLPLFWGSDAMPFIFIALFSTSNGWMTSSIFVSIAERITDAARREQVTTLIVCLLNGGIFCGAALSFVIRYLDCTPGEANDFDCNPFISPVLNVTG